MKLLFSFFVLLLTYSINSQTITIGPVLGLNIIDVEKQQSGDNFQLGLHVGGVIDYRINNLISIESGIQLTQKRQLTNDADTSLAMFLSFLGPDISIPGIDLNTYSKIESRQSQSYIEIPVLAVLNFSGFRVSAGMYAGFMVSSKRKDKTISDTPLLSIIDLDSLLGATGGAGGFLSAFLPKAHEESFSETSDKSNLTAFDFGLRAGIGYQKNEFGFYASYNFGLSDFRKDRKNDDIKRHQYFQLSVRYMLPIKKKSKSSS